MKWLSTLIKRYKFFIVVFLANLLLFVFCREIGIKSFAITWNNILEMLIIMPPIFLLLGLLDVWVERETMTKLMGVDSRYVGIFIAFLLGSFAAGPLYAAFPVAEVLLRKGVKLSNVFIFIGAWSSTKIPLLLFEASSLGIKFTLIRLAIDVPGIILIAFFTQSLLSKKDKEKIYTIAQTERN